MPATKTCASKSPAEWTSRSTWNTAGNSNFNGMNSICRTAVFYPSLPIQDTSTPGVKASGRSGRSATSSWFRSRSTPSPCAAIKRRRPIHPKCSSSMDTLSITLSMLVVSPVFLPHRLILSTPFFSCFAISICTLRSWSSLHHLPLLFGS